MNYWDESRPRLNGHPTYHGVILPAAMLRPFSEGWHLTLWLCVGPNRFRDYHATLHSWPRVAQYLHELEDDPEKFFTERFGWSYDASPPSTAPTLRELGLI